MAFNLLETVSGFFTNDVINKTASSLGESENNVQRATRGLVPSVLAGILNKVSSGSNVAAADNVLQMAKQASGSGILNNLTSLLGGGGGTGSMANFVAMAGNIFGDKVSNVTNATSNYAGIKPSSASSLLGMVTPVALAAIGRYASQNNLNASGLLSMLLDQKDKILAAIPSGLGLASALGLGSLSDLGRKAVGSVSGVADEAKKRSRWVTAVLLGLGVLALLLLLGRNCEKEELATNEVGDTRPTADAPSEVAPEVNVTPVKVKLPDGSELDARRGGIEEQLVAFLSDPNSQVSNDRWFDFDNLNFETGSARITTESQQQINNIAAILEAFPKAKIKIGGYTDATGDPVTNKKLSKDRADAVVIALRATGANSSQLLEAEGYGSEFAEVPATASEEERKKDRRVSVSVRNK